ncbi:MAG: hypothetical protein JJU05_15195 [Verrucomicrobia bacterium]|nr:hypothetical protein [Verrucomicrobiota bacterium]MCH8528160.1 DUF6364 family protein [Kiritimatiellia bacterium]
MKSKLTLSLPEKTISEAKQIAKRRHTTVSALFAESIHHWQIGAGSASSPSTDFPIEMSDLLGVLSPQPPFDARSKHIREKHG